MNRYKVIVVVVFCVSISTTPGLLSAEVAWPAQTRQCRPWTYNWWLGSAVDKNNLARELTRYRKCGLGGIHIVPIYGAKGAEKRYIDYLSPKWMEMLSFAVKKAGKLDLGVDMTTGTGWCFGGPHISRNQGCRQVRVKAMDFPRNGTLKPGQAPGDVLAVVAVGPGEKSIDITDKYRAGLASYKPRPGQKLVVLSARPTGRAVKRAAPGGAGPMIDPFSRASMEAYLKPFTAAFGAPGAARPRAMYHDSFEYSANWTAEVLDEFHLRRGYKLQDRLAAFAGMGNPDHVARVKSDYRETLSDLLIDKSFKPWFSWCRRRGILTRDQAHGSPANLIDIYAQADIPETEMFSRGNRNPLRSKFEPGCFTAGDRDILVSKFASSAAHLAGRKLTSSETCTWMAEHFCETLEEAKCFVDLLLAAGVNHVFYHGTAYSPDDAAWPGWLFYAATEMNPRNPIWRDAPALNAYITRCQSVLQAGTCDNDVLLYWPIHDLWHNPAGMAINCTVHNAASWLRGQPVGATARGLWQRGHSFDYVSDRLLEKVSVKGTGLVIGGSRYRAIVLPPVRHIPVATMKKLVELAQAGATVICQDQLPSDVPGMADLETRRQQLKALLAGASDKIRVGKIEPLLARAGIQRETMTDQAGVMFIRRQIDGGRYYFIANQSARVLDTIPLSARAKSVAVMDPMTGRIGLARCKPVNGRIDVPAHIEPGHSIILRTLETGSPNLPPFQFVCAGARSVDIAGPWRVKFLAGGPVLPKDYRMDKPASWTANGDKATKSFAGTALYTTTFDAPAGTGPWVLDLGKVCHSARVRLNGQAVGTALMNPYRLALPKLRPTGNCLEIEITNLAANRIADLDRQKVRWRFFHDINFVNIGYKPFDASNWPVFDSGLIGPVKLLAK